MDRERVAKRCQAEVSSMAKNKYFLPDELRDFVISLDSLVYAYPNGQTAEPISQASPLLRVEQVYGALADYLAHREIIDAYLRKGAADFEHLRQARATRTQYGTESSTRPGPKRPEPQYCAHLGVVH